MARPRKKPRLEPLEIGGRKIEAGQTARIEIPVARLPTQNMLSLPVTVVRGSRPGGVVWLSAAIHGDEINGVEIIRQVLPRLNPEKLRGTVIAVPVLNLFGFINQSRYLPDGRDLNRSFPGSKRGSLAARLANLFLREVVRHAQVGIDLHTGSRRRENMPQIRADLDHPETRRLADAFGAPAVVDAKVRDGSLRGVARERGVPVLVYEAGQNQSLDRQAVETGVRGILRVLAEMGLRRPGPARRKKPSYEVRRSRWLRARRTGLLELEVDPGDIVRKGQTLARISDVFGEASTVVEAPQGGIILGLSRNPVINRGDGMINLGFKSAD